MSRPPPDLEDLDFDSLVAPDAARVVPKPVSAELEEEGLIGAQALKQSGYHVVVVRNRSGTRSGKSLVMVVEDDDDTAALAVRALKNGGHATIRAASSQETSHYLTRLGVPDLILMDVNLPGGLDGFEMLARIRAHPKLRATPVVMFTALSAREDVVRGLTLGADGYIAKPVAPKLLLQVVAQVLGK